MFATFADAGIAVPAGASGEINLPCPKCQGERRKRPHDRPLRLNVERGTWMCYHCPWTGGLANGHATSATKRQIIAAYDYVDEDGELLFQVVRFAPKDFRQRRPDGAGGWIWKLKGTRRVLYRLPEILEADPARWVLLVEGEKDADRVAREGLVATTAPQGAGKWRPEYTDALRGRRVAIVPDLDEKGRQHAALVHRALAGVAAEVRIVTLPGLTAKGADVYDWLDAGHTGDELLELIEAAPAPGEPEADDPEPPRHRRLLVSALEIASSARAPDFIVPGLIERDSLVAVVGPWGSGKSLVAQDLMLRVPSGLAVHGRAVVPGPVVYVAGEGHAGLARRLAAWTARNRASLDRVRLVISEGAVGMLDAEAAEALHDEIAELAEAWGSPPCMIKLDTVARNFGPGDENATADMGAFVAAVNRWLRRPFKAAVVLVHHTGHTDKTRGRGSSVLPAACDAEYQIAQPEPGVVRLSSSSTRPPKDFAPPPPLTWRIVPVPLLLNGAHVESVVLEELAEYQPPAEAAVSERQEAMLAALREELADSRERLTSAGYDPEGARVTVDDWRARGVREGVIGSHRNNFYKVRDALEGKRLIRLDGAHVYPAEAHS